MVQQFVSLCRYGIPSVPPASALATLHRHFLCGNQLVLVHTVCIIVLSLTTFKFNAHITFHLHSTLCDVLGDDCHSMSNVLAFLTEWGLRKLTDVVLFSFKFFKYLVFFGQAAEVCFILLQDLFCLTLNFYRAFLHLVLSAMSLYFILSALSSPYTV